MTHASKPVKASYPLWGVLLALVGLALLGWTLSSLNALHAQIAAVSPKLATAVLVGLLVLLGMLTLVGFRFIWVASRTPRRPDVDAAVAADPSQAAGQSIEAARKQIEFVCDEIARRALADELTALQADLASKRYTIVVFGTTSAGKTSLINALLGEKVGETDVTVGTTRAGVEHEYTIEGFQDGALRLVDTPGLAEFGAGGLMREERARELATQADLLLFVVDQDLRDIEARPLESLARLGKRSLLVFNKRDLYPAADLETVVSRLRERVRGFIDAQDVIVCAADPAPVVIRDAEAGAAGAEKPEPEVSQLAERLADVLRRDGRTLLAGNVLSRAKRVSDKARDIIQQARVKRAGLIVQRFQWTTAGVLFVNPVPGLGALAGAAINAQMVLEIAQVFGAAVGIEGAKRMARELGQVMLKLGVVNIATEILGKALKATIVGYVAGGAIEAVAGAYLTRLAGEAFTDYFAHDQDWGEGGMQAAIERRFKLEGQREFVAAFVKEATERVLKSPRRSENPQ